MAQHSEELPGLHPTPLGWKLALMIGTAALAAYTVVLIAQASSAL